MAQGQSGKGVSAAVPGDVLSYSGIFNPLVDMLLGGGIIEQLKNLPFPTISLNSKYQIPNFKFQIISKLQ